MSKALFGGTGGKTGKVQSGVSETPDFEGGKYILPPVINIGPIQSTNMWTNTYFS